MAREVLGSKFILGMSVSGTVFLYGSADTIHLERNTYHVDMIDIYSIQATGGDWNNCVGQDNRSKYSATNDRYALTSTLPSLIIDEWPHTNITEGNSAVALRRILIFFRDLHPSNKT